MPLKPPPSVLSMHGLTTVLEKKAASLQPGRTPGPATAAPVLGGFPTGTPSWQELRVTPSIHGQGWGGQQELRTCQHPARAPRTPRQEGAQSWSSTPGWQSQERQGFLEVLPAQGEQSWPEKKASSWTWRKEGIWISFHSTMGTDWGFSCCWMKEHTKET